MEGAELQDGAARAGAHDASGDADAGPGTTQLTPPQPARLGPQPPPRLQSAEEICNIVLALGVKAAAEEGASQGGSAGGGSQEATGAQGEEGVIARGTHLATSNMHVDGDQVACNLQSVGSVRSKAAKGKASKETVSITEMARRVKMWGITKPQNAKHSVWKWGFKYAHPTIGHGGGAGRSGVKTFGGGKKAKVGVFTVSDVQDAREMAKKVNICEYIIYIYIYTIEERELS